MIIVGLLVYVRQQLIRLVLVIFGLITVTFFLTRLVTDPVALALGASASEEQRRVMSHSLGMDRPVLTQFVDYLGGLFQGDLGASLWLGTPSLDIILERIPASLVLAVAGFPLAIVLGLVLGILGGTRPGSFVDRFTTSLSALTMAVPDFWLGLVFVIIFAVNLSWFPTGGYHGPGQVEYLVLPAVTIALLPAGRLARIVRESVAEEMGKAYVLTARARGLTTEAILRKHVLKNIVAASGTVVGYDFLLLFTGSVATVEVIYGWPGLGRLAVEATLHQDVILMSSLVIVTGAIVGIGNIVLDMVITAVDRRVTG